MLLFLTPLCTLVANFCVLVVAKSSALLIAKNSALLLTDYTIDQNAVPKVLGIDDWAFKKGSRYGTIIVDLEKRKIIDLLPDRETLSV